MFNDRVRYLVQIPNVLRVHPGVNRGRGYWFEGSGEGLKRPGDASEAGATQTQVGQATQLIWDLFAA